MRVTATAPAPEPSTSSARGSPAAAAVPVLQLLLAGRLDVAFGRSEGLGQPFPAGQLEPMLDAVFLRARELLEGDRQTG
ncbi:MAG TPA: hypothetical protein VG276_20715 [Actinomycetes bacterium]|jgi:hypothetical protein|nr:hypothetical protein [Actinomycetes bacterium]